MGIWDKKKKSADEFESPVEEINLHAAKTAPVPAPAPAPGKPGAPAAAAAAPARPAAPPPREEDADYGINKAIELMRLLPADNIELVVTVVKATLESTHVKVATIIQDAARKLADIEGRVDGLTREIVDLEKEIATRKGQISALEADHKETSVVKERLTLAEKLSSERKGPAAKAGASG